MSLSWIQRFFKNPKQVASIAPSSPALAQSVALAAHRRQPDAKRLIELGPGSGAVTRSLVDMPGRPEILAVEFNTDLVALMRHRFPGVHCVHGDARALPMITKNLSWKPVDLIVSSLGLRAMSATDVRAFVMAMDQCLLPGGTLVQYTYGLASPIPQSVCRDLNWSYTVWETVWFNLPPARVFVYTKSTQCR